VADPALITAIGGLIAGAGNTVAQVLSAGKRGDLEKRVETLESQQKGLRSDLDTTAGHVKTLRDSARSATGSQPAVREPLASQPDRDTERWRARVDAALEEIERWRESMEKRLAAAETASRRMRERWIAFSTEVRTVLRVGKMSNASAHDLEDDRGSNG
jgi:chaperonin cofactor prefoldin